VLRTDEAGRPPPHGRTGQAGGESEQDPSTPYGGTGVTACEALRQPRVDAPHQFAPHIGECVMYRG
jgi:hypothetical protein